MARSGFPGVACEAAHNDSGGAERLEFGSRKYFAKQTSGLRRRLIPKTEINPDMGNVEHSCVLAADARYRSAAPVPHRESSAKPRLRGIIDSAFSFKQFAPVCQFGAQPDYRVSVSISKPGEKQAILE